MELNSPYRPCRDTPSLPLCNGPGEQRNRKWDGCDQSLPGSSAVKSASMVSVQVITPRLPRKRLSHPALSRVAMGMTGELKSTRFLSIALYADWSAPTVPSETSAQLAGHTPEVAPVQTNGFQSGAGCVRGSFLKCCGLPGNMQIRRRWGKPCAGWVTTRPCLAGKGWRWRVPSTCFFLSWTTTKAWEAPQTCRRHETGVPAEGWKPPGPGQGALPA